MPYLPQHHPDQNKALLNGICLPEFLVLLAADLPVNYFQVSVWLAMSVLDMTVCHIRSPAVQRIGIPYPSECVQSSSFQPKNVLDTSFVN